MGIDKYTLEELQAELKKRTKGKCHSGVNRGQRKERDLYETPYCMTRLFLDTERFGTNIGTVLEPACGNRAIVKVLKEHGYTVRDRDLEGGYDFLEYRYKQYPFIITNPPFSLAQEFVERAKEVCYFKFAFLLKLDFLSGQKRFEELYQDQQFPLTKVYVFTRMPDLSFPIREDGKIVKTGMQTYAWFVWQVRGPYEERNLILPTIDWLNCQDYICKKKDL